MATDKKKNKKLKEDTAEDDINLDVETTQDDSAQEGQTDFDDPTKKLEAEKNSYVELCQRTKAEFDNYKKRNATLRTDSIDEGMREAISAMLPVIDNLERALDATDDHEHTASIKEGVELIFSQMLGALEGLGLEEIKAEGEVFDPNLHHAVMQGEKDEDNEEDTIMEVFQKGYSLKGKIIRHSMVKVAK